MVGPLTESSQDTHEYDVIVVGAAHRGSWPRLRRVERAPVRCSLSGTDSWAVWPRGRARADLALPFRDEQVVEGIPQQFVDRLVAFGGSTGHMKCTNPHGSGSYLCFYDRHAYKWVALQLILEAGVTPLFHTVLSEAIVEDGRVTGVIVQNKSGRQPYRANVVVDATGDGDVAARAGARTRWDAMAMRPYSRER